MVSVACARPAGKDSTAIWRLWRGCPARLYAPAEPAPLCAISTPQWLRLISVVEYASGLMLIIHPSSSSAPIRRLFGSLDGRPNCHRNRASAVELAQFRSDRRAAGGTGLRGRPPAGAGAQQRRLLQLGAARGSPAGETGCLAV